MAMRKNFELHSRLAVAALVCGGLLAAGALAQVPAPANPSGASATVNRNVYTAGGEVRSTAPVHGDFTAAGGHVIVDQPVSGDAGLAGGSVEVRAPIADDLRVAGGDVKVDAAIGGELFVVGGNVIVTSATVVGRGASLHASKISMDGRIEGELQANADRIVINGEVTGDVRVHASRIELGPRAKIGGALHYVSDNELVKAEGATVQGAVAREEKLSSRARERRAQADADRPSRGGRWAGGVASYLGVLAVAALFLLVAPVFGAGAAQRVRATPWAALGLGFATLLAVPVLAVLLFITVLGIPLGLAVLALYPAVLLLGFVVSVLFIARVVPPAFRLPAPQSFGATMGWFAAALLLVLVVARIPFVGALLMLFVALAGLGAGVLELYARRKGPAAPEGGARADAPASTAGPATDVAGAQA
jgi:cytoskeletal protein CcmA (bactofilin family)